MKFNKVIKLAAVAVVLSFTVVGCHKGLDKTTPLPARGAATVPDAGPTGPITPSTPKPEEAVTPPAPPISTPVRPTENGTPVPISTPPTPASLVDLTKPIPLTGNLGDYLPDSDENQIFKTKTVYFDFDKATIRPSEVSKVEQVASGFKGLSGKALRIEGHCDERGTEEYNRSLGERRALAVREALVRAGVDPKYIDTISFGEDRPADPGHNDAAWSKNRRGEFIVIVPPGAASTSK